MLVKSELLKLRCSPGEKKILMMLVQMESEKRGGEKISYSEIVRQAILFMANKEIGVDKTKDILLMEEKLILK